MKRRVLLWDVVLVVVVLLLSSCCKHKAEFERLHKDGKLDEGMTNFYYACYYGKIAFSDNTGVKFRRGIDWYEAEFYKKLWDIYEAEVSLGEAPSYRREAPFLASHLLSYMVTIRMLNREPFGCGRFEYVSPDEANFISKAWNWVKHLLCVNQDGVSSFIYNACYLANLPKKLILSPFYSIGIIDWFLNLCLLVWGGILALVFLFVGTIVGTVCNPLDTVANLFVGILPYIKNNVYSNYGIYWLHYVMATNLLTSFWTLLVGLVSPLWQILVIVKYHALYICMCVALVVAGNPAKKA